MPGHEGCAAGAPGASAAAQENLGSLTAWEMFTGALPDTAVAYLYVSEHHIKGTNLKVDMRDGIRINRKCAHYSHIMLVSWCQCQLCICTQPRCVFALA